jgi:predicted nucleic-acid-binding protein
MFRAIFLINRGLKFSQPVYRTAAYGELKIPDDVLIQFNLLMMSKIARNIYRTVINVYINNKGIGASSWYIG